MIKYRHVYIIYNPKSTGDSKQLALDFEQKVRSVLPNAEVRTRATKHPGHVEKLVRELLGKKNRVLFVSSSGDGGYNELINAVMAIKHPLQVVDCMVLPAGNANDHSRTMHSGDVVESFESTKAVRIDLLKITITSEESKQVRYAHSYAGLGITPEIAKEVNRHDSEPFREVQLVLKTVRRFKPFKIKSGRKVYKLDSLVFANIHQMAKYMTLGDKNRPRDGRFELLMFKHRGKGMLLFKIMKALVSWVRPQKRLRKYSFTVLQSVSMQLDGEVIEIPKGARVTVRNAYRALRTLI